MDHQSKRPHAAGIPRWTIRFPKRTAFVSNAIQSRRVEFTAHKSMEAQRRGLDFDASREETWTISHPPASRFPN